MSPYRRHVGALLRRNLVYRKRSWFSSIVQLVLPFAMIGILLLIKDSLKDDDTFKPRTISAIVPSESIKPFSFLDYVTAVRTPRKCIPMTNEIRFQDSGFWFKPYSIEGINPENWPVPFLKCDFRNCKKNGEDASDYCAVNVLAIAPAEKGETGRVEAFQAYIEETYPQIQDVDMIKVFDSSNDIDKYVRDAAYGDINKDRPKIAVAVVIGGSDKEYEYTIRTNSTNNNSVEFGGRPVQPTTPDTKNLLDSTARRADDVCALQGGTPRVGVLENQCTVQYMYNGALTIQRLVDDFIIDDTGAKDLNVNVAENGVSFVDFPSNDYIQDGFYAQVSAYVPLLLILGLLYPVAAVARSIVIEKELRQKELMKMMSISESAIELAWFITSYGQFLLSAILVTIATSALYPNASVVILLFFWILAFLAIVVFTMAIAACFVKSTRATLISILAFFAGYFLTLSAAYDTGSRGIIFLVSIHPVAAMSYGLQIIGSLEDAGVGVTSSTFDFTDSPNGYTFRSAIVSFIFATLFWGYQMWYLNRVVPGDYGQALPWYFPYTLSYWRGIEASEVQLEGWEDDVKYADVPIEKVGATLKEQERAGNGVHIRGLTKTFGEKTAVTGLDLSMYTGQVFALLGHNGAGKTTTISMLTGMFSPSKGYAVINGKDIRTQMQEIREDLGICLQHDCLFPQLTVKEHLRFFSRIKGLYESNSYQDAEDAVDMSIRDVALFEKRNTFSKDLSGGMKRKLSLAVAFCGGSKVVFLDEPTSGMDTFSRRFIWDVIRQNRQDRCIVLTTHFMDEADLLGDRIGIMAEGNLRCVGSSLFLKKKYGVGYNITIEKSTASDEISESTKALVERAVPEASMLSNVSSEIKFRLPIESSNRFASMFADLDEKIADGDIETYGVGITTLDEVFLAVARGETTERTVLRSSIIVKDDEDGFEANNPSHRSQEDVGATKMFATHVRCLFAKRALNFKRDKKAWVCSTILPVMLTLFGFMTVIFLGPNKNMGPLELQLTDLNAKSSKESPFPINRADNFLCQPATCLASFDTDAFYNNTGYCGSVVAIENANEVQCSDVTINGLTSVIEAADLIPIEQDVSNVEEASIQLPKNPKEKDFGETQYGALYFTHTLSSVIESSQELFQSTVESLCNGFPAKESLYGSFSCANFAGLGYVVSTNFTAPHASLLFQGFADEAIIREALDDNEYKIKTTIHPLPITKIEGEFSQAENSFSAWFYLVLSFPFIAGSFGSFIVQERESKAKHLQTVAGVKPGAYWLSSYAWDIMNYQFPLWTVIAMMYAFGIDAFTTSENSIRSATIVLLILFGPAIAGFTYITTFMFKSPSACNMFTIVFNFFVGLAGALVTLILRSIHGVQVLNGNPGNLLLISQIIEWILRLVPSFNFAKGLLFAINIQIFQLLNGDNTINAWDSDIMLIEVLILAAQCVFYPVVATYIDIWSTRPSCVRFFSGKKIKELSGGEESLREDVDEDVAEEAIRVLNGDANRDTIVMNELTKQYPNGKIAVHGISLGIPGGQCFGLLGINGAGKTTAMGILTAEFPPTSGDATLAGFSVTSQPEETRRHIGYCPQFDAHFTNLTGREHVELYAAIKGIPRDSITDAASSKLTEVGLSTFDSDRLSSQYSGGMKRKLSVACATIGNPEIVFLDEPSTGMDPVSRRDLWGVISRMVVGESSRGVKTSVILTTHSMEECEALCPRIGIMAGGTMKCIGSAQHLKTRFGKGYQVDIKVDEPAEEDDDLKEVVGVLLGLSPRTSSIDPESGMRGDVFFNEEEAKAAALQVSGDDSVSSMITEHDPVGYVIYKNASAGVGVELNELAAFCATELRMKRVQKFFSEKYPDSILRETQDTRMRFEVSSEGNKISSLFASVESNKVNLHLQDYGISQTTLEQVFNMHAAHEEAKKQGTDDK